MARIRSIKPEFWRDEKIATLKNKLAGYFFIGLWNVADDEGKFPLSPRALALQLPIFRSKEVVTYLSELSQKGLIQKSECSQWGLITNWSHQRIDKPQVPKVKLEDIQWLPVSDSTNGIEQSRPIDARIGSDRKGKDSIGEDKSPRAKRARKPTASVVLTNEVIAVYCDEWKKRYPSHSSPIILPASAKHMKTLVEAIGIEKAKTLVTAYLQMNDKWYVTKRHDIWTLVNNIQAVQQFAESGRHITAKDAQDIEAQESLKNQIERLGSGEVA